MKPDRTHWSKLMLPPELADMVKMIAKKQGYKPVVEVHLFIHDMLKRLYSNDVEQLEAYLGTDWQEQPEEPN